MLRDFRKVVAKEEYTCYCCNNNATAPLYSLFVTLEHIPNLSIGYVSFFKFLKQLIGIMVVWSIISLYPILRNYRGDVCQDKEFRQEDYLTISEYDCPLDYYTMFSLSNIGMNDVNFIDLYIQTAFIYLLYIYLGVYKAYLQQFNEKHDLSRTSPSDFAILLEGISPSVGDQPLREFLENIGELENTKIVVKDLIHLKDIGEYIEKKNKFIKMKIKVIVEKTPSTKQIKALQTLRDSLKEAYNTVVENNLPSIQTEKVIVIFESVSMTEKILKYFQDEKTKHQLLKSLQPLNYLSDYHLLNKLNVSSPNEPSDFVYENQMFSVKQLADKKLALEVMTIGFILFTFRPIILVENARLKSEYEGNNTNQYVYAGMQTAIIQVLLYGAQYIVALFVVFERNLFKSWVVASEVTKTTVTQVFFIIYMTFYISTSYQKSFLTQYSDQVGFKLKVSGTLIVTSSNGNASNNDVVSKRSHNRTVYHVLQHIKNC